MASDRRLPSFFVPDAPPPGARAPPAGTVHGPNSKRPAPVSLRSRLPASALKDSTSCRVPPLDRGSNSRTSSAAMAGSPRERLPNFPNPRSQANPPPPPSPPPPPLPLQLPPNPHPPPPTHPFLSSELP